MNMQIIEEAQRAKPRQLLISITTFILSIFQVALYTKELCVIGIDSTVPSKEQHEFEE